MSQFGELANRLLDFCIDSRRVEHDERFDVRHFLQFAERTPYAMMGCLDDQAQLIEQLNHSIYFWKSSRFLPRVSIIMPAYNSNPVFLEHAICSVIWQSYSNWELVIVDDASASQLHFSIIKKYQDLCGSKIVFQSNAQNLGISESRNKAIAISSGEYIAILDHDDVLHPLALSEMLRSILVAKANFAYSFEAKLSEDGLNLKEFLSKPKFSWFDLLHFNYICHFTVISRALLAAVRIGKATYFDRAYDGAEDHELFLRCAGLSNFKPVAVPLFLYLWRMSAESTSLDQNTKPASFVNGRNASLKFLGSKGFDIAEGITEHPFRSHQFIVPQKTRGRKTVRVLESAVSSEKLAEQLSFQTDILIDYVEPSYSGAYIDSAQLDRDIRSASATYILLAHPTIKFRDSIVLRDCIGWLENFRQIGSIGASVIDMPRVPDQASPECSADNYPVHSAYCISEVPATGGGFRFSSFVGKRWFAFESREVLANTKHFMMFRKSDYKKIGGFDSLRFPFEGFDLDLCLRLRKMGMMSVSLGVGKLRGYALDECKLGYGNVGQGSALQHCEASSSIFQLCYNFSYHSSRLSGASISVC